MTTEHFQTVIRAFQRRSPFRAYVVELVGGDRIVVKHPEALVVRGGVGDARVRRSAGTEGWRASVPS